MTSKFAAAALAGLTAVSLCAPAWADGKPTKAQRNQTRALATIPSCTKSLGTLSIIDGDDPSGWTQFSLAPPQKLLKVMVQRSGCFKLVDRGAGMAAAQRERELASGGDLQRGSNVGKGQIMAADYVLVAEVAGANANASGNAAGAAIGGLIGGSVGGLIGGIQTRKLEANTVLTITDVRTSATVAVEEGYASKTDLSFGAGGGIGGWGGFGGAVGGGYENTDIGKIVTQSFIEAYAKLVTNLGGVSDNAAASAPAKAYSVASPATLREKPSDQGKVLRTLPAGALVYPTGVKDGMWWEVVDENDNSGWVRNDKLQPAG